MNAQLLVVDDEQLVLESLRRTLHRRYQAIYVSGAQEALLELRNNASIKVLLTDYRMPDINGLILMEEVRKKYPHVIRIMLTGEADLRVAIGAVNSGEVFRFLTKPVDRNQLFTSLDAALRQCELEQNEKDILDQTVSGSIRLVMELSQIMSEPGHQADADLRNAARAVVEELQLGPAWVVDLALALEPLGRLSLPQELRQKWAAGDKLKPDEESLLQDLDKLNARLIGHIPRLQPVRKVLTEVNEKPQGSALVVRLIRDLIHARRQSMTLNAAIEEVALQHVSSPDHIVRAVMNKVRRVGTIYDKVAKRHIEVRELLVGDRMCEDLITDSGKLICPSGMVITLSTLERIQRFCRTMPCSQRIEIERVRKRKGEDSDGS